MAPAPAFPSGAAVPSEVSDATPAAASRAGQKAAAADALRSDSVAAKAASESMPLRGERLRSMARRESCEDMPKRRETAQWESFASCEAPPPRRDLTAAAPSGSMMAARVRALREAAATSEQSAQPAEAGEEDDVEEFEEVFAEVVRPTGVNRAARHAQIRNMLLGLETPIRSAVRQKRVFANALGGRVPHRCVPTTRGQLVDHWRRARCFHARHCCWKVQ